MGRKPVEAIAARWPKQTIEERFWSKVDKNGPTPEHMPSLGPCWVWTKAVDVGGYGIFSDRTSHHAQAHRFAWTLTHGQIAKGINILHHCDNPRCVRDSHLFAGTQADNVLDAFHKGRLRAYKSRERHWNARLTEASVMKIRKSTGSSTDLAKDYGVDRGTIWRIRTNKMWRLNDTAQP